MSDVRFRAAERNWAVEGTREAWIAYLREARRAGNPVFTAQDVRMAPTALEQFEFTEEGFIARITRAEHPPIERIHRFPVGPDDYDEESVPIWGWWSGNIVVKWDYCPSLSIEVETCDVTEILTVEASWDDWAGAAREASTLIGEHQYEGDCVTNAKELNAALGDWDNWFFNE